MIGVYPLGNATKIERECIKAKDQRPVPAMTIVERSLTEFNHQTRQKGLDANRQ